MALSLASGRPLRELLRAAVPVASVTVAAGRSSGGLALWRMRDHPQQRKPVDPLLAQKVRRVTLLFLQHEDEQAARIDVLRARHRGVHHRLLNHPVEPERPGGARGSANVLRPQDL